MGTVVKELETENFKVFFRTHAMQKLECKRCYKHCWALPFMVYVDAKGNLWPCIVFMGRDELKIWKFKMKRVFVRYGKGNTEKKLWIIL